MEVVATIVEDILLQREVILVYAILQFLFFILFRELLLQL